MSLKDDLNEKLTHAQESQVSSIYNSLSFLLPLKNLGFRSYCQDKYIISVWYNEKENE